MSLRVLVAELLDETLLHMSYFQLIRDLSEAQEIESKDCNYTGSRFRGSRFTVGE